MRHSARRFLLVERIVMATLHDHVLALFSRVLPLLAVCLIGAPGCVVPQVAPMGGQVPSNGIWFTGTYVGERARLSLVQQRDRVTGQGEFDGLSGTVEGEVSGAGVRGRYTTAAGQSGAFAAVLTDAGLELTVGGKAPVLLAREEADPPESDQPEEPDIDEDEGSETAGHTAEASAAR
jgi:hypothetical protein